MRTDSEIDKEIDDRFNDILKEVYIENDVSNMPETIDDIELTDDLRWNNATNDSV